jgi:hypothetical protein
MREIYVEKQAKTTAKMAKSPPNPASFWLIGKYGKLLLW